MSRQKSLSLTTDNKYESDKAQPTNFKILQTLFPNLHQTIFKEYCKYLERQTLSQNYLLCPINELPLYVFYIIKGEVRVEQIIRKKLNSSIQFQYNQLQSRVLLILCDNSLIGEIEALLQKPYANNIRINAYNTTILKIPVQIYVDLKKRQTGLDSCVKVIQQNPQLMSHLFEIRKREKLRPSSSFNINCSQNTIEESPTKEDLIVQQNKKILLKRHELQDKKLTLEAPLYYLPNRKRLVRNIETSTRPRSISVPLKSKLQKSQENSVNTDASEIFVNKLSDYRQRRMQQWNNLIDI